MSTIDKIIELLKRSKKTQKDLTDYLGLEKSTFTAWKTLKSRSYQRYLPAIAEFFKVSVSFLVDNEQYELPKEELTGIYFKLGKEAQELGLDEEDVENILNLYRKHAKNNK